MKKAPEGAEIFKYFSSTTQTKDIIQIVCCAFFSVFERCIRIPGAFITFALFKPFYGFLDNLHGSDFVAFAGKGINSCNNAFLNVRRVVLITEKIFNVGNSLVADSNNIIRNCLGSVVNVVLHLLNLEK